MGDYDGTINDLPKKTTTTKLVIFAWFRNLDDYPNKNININMNFKIYLYIHFEKLCGCDFSVW